MANFPNPTVTDLLTGSLLSGSITPGSLTRQMVQRHSVFWPQPVDGHKLGSGIRILSFLNGNPPCLLVDRPRQIKKKRKEKILRARPAISDLTHQAAWAQPRNSTIWFWLTIYSFQFGWVEVDISDQFQCVESILYFNLSTQPKINPTFISWL